ncbi:RDD family protein [Flavobacterium sp. N1994]|uniref:RDD family protein n=1 Tax=Flavobacterium sp. N1994 TaxID=2986827 RepID=UPI002221E17A|nr:RDD family protein [Flavobacterium sp. N1994]
MSLSNKKQYQVTDEVLASIGQRFLNYLLDMIMQLLLIMVFAIIASIVAGLFGNKSVVTFFATIDKNTIALYTICYAIALIYYNFFEIVFARTIGKFITQTVVVDANGEKPHQETILIRSLCRLIPFDPLSLLVSQTRAWHDTLSKTYVVDKKALEQAKRKFYTAQETTTEE